MRLFESAKQHSLDQQPAQQSDLVPQRPEPPPAPGPFLETQPAVMPYVPTTFDLPL